MALPTVFGRRLDAASERTAAASPLAVQVADVWKAFLSGVHVLRGVSFQVARGDVVVVEGPTGAGKSTLLRLVAGIDRPNAGRIAVSGVEVSANGPASLAQVRRAMGLFLTGMPLLAHLTVGENVALALRAARTPLRERRVRVYESLKTFGLEGRRDDYPDQLSAGEAQRVCLARALAPRPAVVLADEPTAMLDRATAASVLAVLREVHARGVTVLVVSHDPEVGHNLGARRLFLRGGRIEEAPAKRGCA
jgi:putative ABC transport system ATP-binding protein